MSPRLELQLDRDRFSPGETVTGTVLVTEGGSSRRLEVTLDYHERGEDEYQRVAQSLSGGELHTGDLATGASYPFSIELPADALPSYKSNHGELWWELDARSDELGRDTHARRRIEVVTPPRD